MRKFSTDLAINGERQYIKDFNTGRDLSTRLAKETYYPSFSTVDSTGWASHLRPNGPKQWQINTNSANMIEYYNQFFTPNMTPNDNCALATMLLLANPSMPKNMYLNYCNNSSISDLYFHPQWAPELNDITVNDFILDKYRASPFWAAAWEDMVSGKDPVKIRNFTFANLAIQPTYTQNLISPAGFLTNAARKIVVPSFIPYTIDPAKGSDANP